MYIASACVCHLWNKELLYFLLVDNFAKTLTYPAASNESILSTNDRCFILTD